MKKSRKISTPSYLFLFLIVVAPNLYGKGGLIVTQSDTFWHLQLNLPVLGMFDLDTKPSSQKRLAQMKSKLTLMRSPSAIVSLPEQCHITHQNVLIPEEYLRSGLQRINKNTLDTTDIDDAVNNYHHTDVEVTLMFNCLDEVKQLQFTLFDTFPGFYAVDVDWKINLGSGKAELTSSNSTVHFLNEDTLKG